MCGNLIFRRPMFQFHFLDVQVIEYIFCDEIYIVGLLFKTTHSRTPLSAFTVDGDQPGALRVIWVGFTENLVNISQFFFYICNKFYIFENLIIF